MLLGILISHFWRAEPGSIPAKWLKPLKPLPHVDTLVNLTTVPIVVLVLLGFVFHQDFH